MSVRILLQGGWLVTMVPGSDPVRGDLLIEADRIAAVGRLDHVSDAEVVEARDRIVLPGLTTVVMPASSASTMPSRRHQRPGPAQGRLAPDLIADAGGRASVAPEVEANMGHGPAATARLRSRGIPTGLSADVCTNVGGDLFGAMRVAIALQRGADHAGALARGETLGEVSMRAREVLAMATVDGARACGLDDRIGTLEVGKQADVLVLRADMANMAPMSDPIGAVVHCAGTHNVDSVYVAGRPVKRDGRFVDLDVRSVVERATSSHDYLLGLVADHDWSPQGGQ